MSNLQRKKQLAKKAMKLLKEYRECIRVFGAEKYVSVELNDTYDVITTVDEDGEEIEYNISEVSSEISSQLNGIGPCSSVFYENLELCKDEYELRNKYEEVSKKEFIDYVGKLHYAEFRCPEICEELEEIEEEYNEL